MAEHLHSTVAEAKARTARAELLAWLTYWRVRPQLHDHLSNAAALIAGTVARSAGAKGVTHDDFLLKYGSAKPDPTPEELAAKLQAFRQQFKGTFTNG